MKSSVLCALISAIVLTLLAMPANAQATRTWVSGVGDDANPCSRTAPCKTFAGAISKTAIAGEINVLDPGGFGALTITKSITIQSIGNEAGVLVSGTNGFLVAAGVNDVVNIVGLDFMGLNNSPDGIKVISGKFVHIHNCIIREFTTSGIHVIPTAGNLGPTYVLVTDTILDNNLFGVATASTDATATATTFLDHVTVMGNLAAGGVGVATAGSQGSVVLNNSTVVKNAIGTQATTGSQFFSFGNNRVVQNAQNTDPANPAPNQAILPGF